jgi:FKBP-type peptidyl-prolyl cis-trans isomerase
MVLFLFILFYQAPVLFCDGEAADKKKEEPGTEHPEKEKKEEAEEKPGIEQPEKEKKGEPKPEEADKKEPAEGKEMTLQEKKSYLVGLTMGGNIRNQFKQMDIKLVVEFVIRGFADSMREKKPLLTSAEVGLLNKAILQDIENKNKEKMNKIGQKHLKEGTAYLEANAKRKEVKTTESGLQYEVLKEGTGPKPKPTDKVQVHYKGTFIDGRVFDSSLKRGKPYETYFRNIIKGWIEGIQLMNVGAKYRFVIPYTLAYGPKGYRSIPPNCVLIFEIELLDIVTPKPKK